MRLQRFSVALACVTLTTSALASCGLAQSPSAANDPGFDGYFCVDQLTSAWLGLDASGLTDVGLRLAEGERVLLRSHKSVSAAECLELAAVVAIETNNMESLERIQKSTAVKDSPKLLAQVRKGIEKTKEQSEAPAAYSVSIDDYTPEAYRAYRNTVNAIRRARLAGDIAAIVAIEKFVAGTGTTLSDAAKVALSDYLKEVAAATTNARGGPSVVSRLMKRFPGFSCDMQMPTCDP